MSFKFYLYEIGCVDFFNGMTRLSDYIKLCDEKMIGYDYPSYIELKKFLIICFMEIKTSIIQWEGDIRGSNEIFISAIPRSGLNNPYKLICFKKDDGGQSYVVSECKLNFLNEKNQQISCVIAIKDIEKRDIIRSFHESHDLVEELFEKALNITSSNKNKYLENFEREMNEFPIENKNDTDEDKFNKSNYVQL